MKIKSIFLQLPLWLLVFASFSISLYLAIKGEGISYFTPLILLVIIILYIAGRVIDKR